MPAIRNTRAQLRPSGFVVLRTPALPFNLWYQPEGHEIRPELCSLPLDVREALYLASPGLVNRLTRVPSDDGAKQSLFRYLTRMACRPTPFGLLAGFSVGRVAARNRLVIPDFQARRHRQIGVALLEAMLRRVGTSRHNRWELPFVVNPGLLRAGDRVHCPQGLASVAGFDGEVLSIEPTPTLEQLLVATGPIPAEGWTDRLRVLEPTIAPRAARHLIAELIDAEILLPALTISVTAPDPSRPVLTELNRIPRTRRLGVRLRAVTRILARKTRGASPLAQRTYESLARKLNPLPGAESVSVFQADLSLGGDVTVGHGVLAQVAAAVDWLYRWTVLAPHRGVLDRFRRLFRERYADRSIPLLEALDEEIGIGVPMDEPIQAMNGAADPRHGLVLERLASVWRHRRPTLEMSWDDPDRFPAPRDLLPPPNALAVVGSIAAESTDAIDRGDYQFRLRAVRGPSGAELLGRLATVEPRLARRLRHHLRAEEALDPDAVFAEVVHVPSPAIAPLQRRPALRRHEIVGYGRSGVSSRHQIPLADLLLRVPPPGDRVELWSARLGCRVHPRLSTAHAFTRDAWPPYRFLGLAQRDGLASALEWDWGGLVDAPFLPRVALGRFVLAPARWRLPASAVGWRQLQRSERLAEIARWRSDWNVPRFVVLVGAEGDFTMDLERPESIETLLHSIGNSPPQAVAVEEMFPAPDAMPVIGPGGRFAHDLVIPFLRREAGPIGGTRTTKTRPARRSSARRQPADSSRRTLLPGSECLYLKLYCGPTGADRLLVEGLAPLVDPLVDSGAIQRWFFIRYADPELHIRLRLFGAPDRLASEALPAARKVAETLLTRGVLWRLTLDTYQREVERFGGPDGVDLMERISHADSLAVLRLLAGESETAAAGDRLGLAVLGVDRLLEGLSLPFRQRLALVDGLIDRVTVGDVRAGWEKEAGALFRSDRHLLESRRASAVFRARDQELRPLAAGARAGNGLIADLVHLHCNRLLLSAWDGQEQVVLRWLARLYRSRLARKR